MIIINTNCDIIINNNYVKIIKVPMLSKNTANFIHSRIHYFSQVNISYTLNIKSVIVYF